MFRTCRLRSINIVFASYPPHYFFIRGNKNKKYQIKDSKDIMVKNGSTAERRFYSYLIYMLLPTEDVKIVIDGQKNQKSIENWRHFFRAEYRNCQRICHNASQSHSSLENIFKEPWYRFVYLFGWFWRFFAFNDIAKCGVIATTIHGLVLN